MCMKVAPTLSRRTDRFIGQNQILAHSNLVAAREFDNHQFTITVLKRFEGNGQAFHSVFHFTQMHFPDGLPLGLPQRCYIVQSQPLVRWDDRSVFPFRWRKVEKRVSCQISMWISHHL